MVARLIFLLIFVSSVALGQNKGHFFVYDTDAANFFNRMDVLGASAPFNDKLALNNVFIQLKATISSTGSTSNYDEIDFIQLRGTWDKIADFQNLKSGAFGCGSIDNGDYGGSWVSRSGLQGSASNTFRVNTGYNPGDGARTYKYVNNNYCWSLTLLTDEANDDIYDMSGVNSGGSNGTYMAARKSQTLGYLTETFPNGSLARLPVPYAYGPIERVQTATKDQIFFSGYKLMEVNTSGATVVNSQFREFGYFSSTWFAPGYSNKMHGAFYAGSSKIDREVVNGIIYKYYLKPLSNAQAKMGNRILLEGDGRTGYNSNDVGTGVPALSSYAEILRHAIVAINGGVGVYAGWFGFSNGEPNRKLSDILIQALMPTTANSYFDSDVAVLFAGTSDVEFDVGLTVTQLYNRHLSWETAKVAAGYTKIIDIGPCGEGSATYPSGLTTAQVTQFHIDVDTMLKTYYTISTGISHVYKNSNGHYYISLLEDATMVDYNDTTYFNADKAHLTTAGSDIISAYIVSICQTF